MHFGVGGGRQAGFPNNDDVDQATLDRLNEMYLKDNEKPLKRDVLAQLPRFKFSQSKEESKNNKDDDSNKCSVCYYEYKEGDNLMVLPCFHKYHDECITGWLKTQDFCPVCRTKIE